MGVTLPQDLGARAQEGGPPPYSGRPAAIHWILCVWFQSPVQAIPGSPRTDFFIIITIAEHVVRASASG